MEIAVIDRNFSAEDQDTGARRAVPAGNSKLLPELFEGAGVVVGETPSVVTSATPFGQNIRSKSYFESVISNEWRKNVGSIVQTGALLLEAEEELDRDVFRALKTPFTVRVSQMLRRIARHPILRDKTYHGSFPACWRTLYALAEIDDHSLLRAALADGRIHPGLQRKDIRDALGLPPKPPRGRRKGNGQTEAPLDPVAVWKTFTTNAKQAILDREGRSGLAKLLSPELMVDLVDHLIRQELVGASTKLKPAVTFTAILRTALDPATNDSGAAIGRFRAKLKSLNLDLHSVSVALKGRGKR